jgi:hypothetical protein
LPRDLLSPAESRNSGNMEQRDCLAKERKDAQSRINPS